MKHTIYADLDTMVFEGREQNYGAFKMRKKYNRILNRSMLIAALLFLSITGLPKVISWIMPAGDAAVEATTTTFTIAEVDLPPVKREEEVKEPPLPPEVKKPEPPAPVKTIAFTIIEPSPDPDPSATVTDMDSLLIDTAAIGNKDIDGKAFTGEIPWEDFDTTGFGGPGETVVINEKPKHTDFFIGEEPRPINMDKFRKDCGYPAQAIEAEIEGKVIVRVLVDEEGKYLEHVVLKDPHPVLTKRVESKLNVLRFTPGIQGNKPVMVWVTIPVDFQLTN